MRLIYGNADSQLKFSISRRGHPCVHKQTPAGLLLQCRELRSELGRVVQRPEERPHEDASEALLGRNNSSPLNLWRQCSTRHQLDHCTRNLTMGSGAYQRVLLEHSDTFLRFFTAITRFDLHTSASGSGGLGNSDIEPAIRQNQESKTLLGSPARRWALADSSFNTKEAKAAAVRFTPTAQLGS